MLSRLRRLWFWPRSQSCEFPGTDAAVSEEMRRRKLIVMINRQRDRFRGDVGIDSDDGVSYELFPQNGVLTKFTPFEPAGPVNLPQMRLLGSSVPRNFRIAGDTATRVHES
jgi:hypothetical protein